MAAVDDETIVAMALADRRYFGLLYQRYADRLYWYALTQTGSAADADDIVAETMIVAMEQLHRFDRSRGTFATWIFTIGHRKVIDHHRSLHRLRRLVKRSFARADQSAETDALERVLASERVAELHAAVTSLSRDDQEIIALRYSAGLESREIAQILGLSEASARKRLSRAVGRLRMRLQNGET